MVATLTGEINVLKSHKKSVVPFAQPDLVNFITEIEPMAQNSVSAMLNRQEMAEMLEEPEVQEAFRRHGIPLHEPYPKGKGKQSLQPQPWRQAANKGIGKGKEKGKGKGKGKEFQSNFGKGKGKGDKDKGQPKGKDKGKSKGAGKDFEDFRDVAPLDEEKVEKAYFMRAQDPAAGAIPERLHSKHIGVPIIYQGEAKIYQGGAVAAVATTSKATSSKARFPGGLHKVPPPPRATGLESVVPSSSAAAAADDYQASTESTPSRPNFTGSDTSEGSGVNHAELLTSQARAAFMQLAAEAANLVPLDLSLPGPPPPPSARLTFPIDQHPLMKGHPPPESGKE